MEVSERTNIWAKGYLYTWFNIFGILGGFVFYGGLFILLAAPPEYSSNALFFLFFGTLVHGGVYLYQVLSLSSLKQELQDRNVRVTDLNEIRILLNQEQYSEALHKIENSLSKPNPEMIQDLNFIKGIVLFKLERFEEVIRIWDDLTLFILNDSQKKLFLDIYPDLKKIEINNTIDEGRYDIALQMVKKLMFKIEETVELLILQSIIEIKLNKIKNAKKTLKKALKSRNITYKQRNLINSMLEELKKTKKSSKEIISLNKSKTPRINEEYERKERLIIFQKLINNTDELELKQLCQKLGFSAIKKGLEPWLTSLDIGNFIIDWNKNTLIITQDLKDNIEKLILEI
jgi:tetratricopeptide (TPR) repeat protein